MKLTESGQRGGVYTGHLYNPSHLVIEWNRESHAGSKIILGHNSQFAFTNEFSETENSNSSLLTSNRHYFVSVEQIPTSPNFSLSIEKRFHCLYYKKIVLQGTSFLCSESTSFVLLNITRMTSKDKQNTTILPFLNLVNGRGSGIGFRNWSCYRHQV